jgi:hypothetical protein
MHRANPFHTTFDHRPWLRGHEALVVKLRRAAGALLTLNFAVFWLVPIAVQGQAFKLALHHVCSPIYDWVDRAPALRRFAARWIYRKPVHVDYFATAIFFLLSVTLSLGFVFYWQIAHGSLPWWLIAAYFFAWVGFGGRGMGAAYTFAHREGHRPGGRLYQPWIRNSVGNFFENWVGFFFGNVPYNFSTSHNLLHHRLNAGKGDPFYMWDIDRTSIADLMLYQHRIFVYMTGWSSLKAFAQQLDSPQVAENYRKLLKGFVLYWAVVPGLIFSGLVLAGSTPLSALAFLFFIYFQPLCAMSFFLAFINVGFHGLIEFDENGKHIECVASSTILDGEDDSFGEDDHMAHHYFTAVEHVDLPAHQAKQHAEWAKHQATVFKEMAIVELALFIQLGQFKMLAEKHYVDYAGVLGTEEIAQLLEERAKRVEMSYEDYEFRYLPTLRARADQLVRGGTCRSVSDAYRYQAHHNLQCDSSVPTS